MYDTDAGLLVLARAALSIAFGMLPEKANDLGTGIDRICIVESVSSVCWVGAAAGSGSSSMLPKMSSSESLPLPAFTTSGVSSGSAELAESATDVPFKRDSRA